LGLRSSRFRTRSSEGVRGKRRCTWRGRGTGTPTYLTPGNTGDWPDKKPPKDDVEALKRKLRAIEARLRYIHVRIKEIEQGDTTPKYQAVLDPEKCAGCGVCLDSCPTGAISLGKIARIDPKRCVGCGRCIEICAQEALSLLHVGVGFQEQIESPV
jgi:ferredoxin